MRHTKFHDGLQGAAKAIALAVGVVLAASSDFELVAGADGLPPEHICAKSAVSCDAAIQAINNGWWAPELRGRRLTCSPHPDCFNRRSLCIVGYNCDAEVRR